MELPYVTVIIPNYNQSLALYRCLKAVIHQTYQPELYQIIVVDNGSTNDLSDLRSQFPQVTFLRIDHPKSPYICRNRAIDSSIGNIIALTDSNSYPANDWLANGIKGLINSKVKIAVGMVKFIATHSINPGQVIEILTFPTINQNQDSTLSGTAKNLFVARSLFNEIGKFLPVRSNGDSEFIHRAYKCGYQTLIIENAVVYYPPPTLKKALSKQFRLGRGNLEIAAMGKDREPLKWFFRAILEMRPPNPSYVSRIVQEKGQSYGINNNVKTYLCVWLARLFKGLGRLSGLKYLVAK